MAITFSTPGQYTLGGISAPRTGVAQAFQAGVSANLGRQEARQVMQEREQAMQLRASEEQRRQQQFEAAQRAAAAAAARAAQIRAAQAEAIKNRPAGLTIPTTTTTAAPPPAGMRLGSMPTPDMLPMVPSGGVQGGTGGNVAGGGGTAALAGGAGADTLAGPATVPAGTPARAKFGGVAFDVYPDGRIVNTLTNTELPMTKEFDALRSALTQQVAVAPARSFMTPESMVARAGMAGTPTGYAAGAASPVTTDPVQVEVNNAYVRRQIAEVDAAIQSIEGALTAPGSRSNPAATIQRVNDLRQQREALVAQLQETVYPPTPRDIFAEEGPGAAGPPPVVLPGAETAEGPMVEAPTQPTAPTAPMVEAPTQPAAPTGLAMTPPAAQEVNAVAAQTDGDISQFYLRNPASILQTADNAFQDIQRWEGMVRYYQQVGDLNGVIEAEIGLGQARQAFSDMSGQLALAGIQLDNYGPLQLHLQQLYPGGTVEVRPYTDGTVEIFVDGDPIRRDSKEDMLKVYATAFNEEYRSRQAQLAEAAAAARSSAYERQLEVAGEIAVENVKQQGRIDLKLLEAELSRLEGAGDVSLTRVDDPTGQDRPIFEYKVQGQPKRYITFREVLGDGGTPLLQYDFVPLPGSE